jgi:agmatinase
MHEVTRLRAARVPGTVDLVRELGPWGASPWAAYGLPTFLGTPLCVTFDDLDTARPDVVVLGVPWDGTMGAAPGTSRAAAAIRAAEYTGSRGGQWHHGATRVNPLEHLSVVDFGDVPVVPGAVESSFGRIRDVVGRVLRRGAVPLLIGGDHAVTWPHVLALADAHPDRRIGVVHFDAHCDTWPLSDAEYTSHGSPMRQLIDGGTVAGRNFVQIGLRSSTDPRTLAYMQDHGMRSHWMAEIHARGLDRVLDDAVEEALHGADLLFLSVDIDVCDPAFAPATGAPEPGGLTGGELLGAVRRIAHEVGFAAMDVVEVSPPYEAGNQITALLAHRVLLEALTGLAQRRLGLPGPNFCDPRTVGGPPPLEGEALA